MPIEIKELAIKISVSEPGNNAGNTGTSGAQTQAGNSTEPDPALVAACVEKVLELIKQKQER